MGHAHDTVNQFVFLVFRFDPRPEFFEEGYPGYAGLRRQFDGGEFPVSAVIAARVLLSDYAIRPGYSIRRRYRDAFRGSFFSRCYPGNRLRRHYPGHASLSDLSHPALEPGYPDNLPGFYFNRL